MPLKRPTLSRILRIAHWIRIVVVTYAIIALCCLGAVLVWLQFFPKSAIDWRWFQALCAAVMIEVVHFIMNKPPSDDGGFSLRDPRMCSG